MPQIEVKFDIDANGILNVSAKDLGTGKEQKVRIEQSSGLNDAEIEKMQQDAEVHADEDKKKRELAELRNQAESMSFQVEKLMKEHKDKLPKATARRWKRRSRKRAKWPRATTPTDQGGARRAGAGLACREQDDVRIGLARPGRGPGSGRSRGRDRRRGGEQGSRRRDRRRV